MKVPVPDPTGKHGYILVDADGKTKAMAIKASIAIAIGALKDIEKRKQAPECARIASEALTSIRKLTGLE